jgi:hypothetical protein
MHAARGLSGPWLSENVNNNVVTCVQYYVSNLAQEYMAYWARMSGKGELVGRLQRWLLSHPVRPPLDRALVALRSKAAAQRSRRAPGSTMRSKRAEPTCPKHPSESSLPECRMPRRAS